ncbi:helix-turn-helix domain-containing protein [Sphingopyxis terrae]|jgi:hypothetical protein|uniref:DprA-like winged helix domain-containing protein n=1 Tax=Sphingopyxis terrae TaxID=33052 RepID=UPI003F7E205D
MFDDFDPPLAPGVAAKAGAVLAALADDRRGIDDIARATGLAASTVLRVAAPRRDRGGWWCPKRRARCGSPAACRVRGVADVRFGPVRHFRHARRLLTPLPLAAAKGPLRREFEDKRGL